MIYCQISDLFYYSKISPLFEKCIDFIKKSNLTELPLGKTQIHGDLVYVNKMEIETAKPEDLLFERHKKYIDIHIDLVGSELIGLSNGELKIEENYNAKQDVTLFQSSKSDVIVSLNNNFCLVCMPEEKHMPGIKNNDSKVIKCCFKVAF